MPDDLDSWPKIYAAKSVSDEVRQASSSGGIFHELAAVEIARGGIVYACAFGKDLRTRHIRCEDLEACDCCRGSKYVQSDMGSVIRGLKRDLNSGKHALFIGTPCQADAVRMNCDKLGNLLTVDIVCHGVPSPGVFAEWLRVAEKLRGKRIVNYEFRPKNRGWQHLERVIWNDKTSEQDTYLSDAWRYLFYGNKMLRPSCYRCPYTCVPRSSDITIADFWGIEHSSAAGMRDKLGVSLVLVNTKRGMDYFKNASLICKETSLNEAVVGNPMLQHPASYRGSRSEVWSDLYRLGLERLMKQERYLISPMRHALGRAKRYLLKGK